jgi:hypothetical protein
MAKKPIIVVYSELGGRFYATDRYKQEGNHLVITGEKFDVTNQIGEAITKYDIEFKKVTS